MEHYSLIVVTDETAPIRRIDVPKRRVKQLAYAAGVTLTVALIGMVDYVKVRVDHLELDGLRAKTTAQEAEIARFEETLSGVQSNLERLREFERKVRIIANLPGSASSGGDDVSAVSHDADGEPLAGGQGEDEIPIGAEPETQKVEGGDPPEADRSEAQTPLQRVGALREDAERLGLVAHAREMTLKELVDALEEKHHHLASTPAIWPAKGWLTSRFGYRISPFTNARQFHAGIDIAGAEGTPVIAPADGRVTFAGTRGPLGRSLIIEHGYGIRTLYGHLHDLEVKRGDVVQRGQRVASLGSTGRSTGPHLHYVVEVHGKAKNPLDYIFD